MFNAGPVGLSSLVIRIQSLFPIPLIVQIDLEGRENVFRKLTRKERLELERLKLKGRLPASTPNLDDVEVEFQRQGNKLSGEESYPPAFTIAVVTWSEPYSTGPFQDGNECPTPVMVGVSFRSKEDENTDRGQMLALQRAFRASPVGSHGSILIK